MNSGAASADGLDGVDGVTDGVRTPAERRSTNILIADAGNLVALLAYAMGTM